MNTFHTVKHDTVFMVASMGNVQALSLCLSSVLTAHVVPSKIVVLMQGEFPAFDNFYLAQLAELARFNGIEFNIVVTKATGVRDARDWMIQNTEPHGYLWMGDDDVIYCPTFLDDMQRARKGAPDEVAWFSGSKGDLNNRRGYKDFVLEERAASDVKEGCSFNHFYTKETRETTIRVRTLDTGCVIFDRKKLGDARFRLFEDSTNCGGEDTLMAMQLVSKGYNGLFVPAARSYHLEKPNPNFGEFAARGELILRTAALLNLDTDMVKQEFMPWLWKK